MDSINHILRSSIVSEIVKRQVNQSNDGNIGSATQEAEKDTSASSVIATLAPVALIAVIWLSLFLYLRPRFAWNYSQRSRSRLLREHEQTKPLSSGFFNWVPEFWAIPDTEVLQRSSLDAFFFLRMLKVSVVICLVGVAITWPILFPVNATGGGGKKQLNILSFANIGGGKETFRYYAHVGCAYLFFGFVLFMIYRESIYYVNLRQAYLMNPSYARKLPSRTVLYTSVPDDYLDEAKLKEMLGPHVKRVWFPTDTKKLEELVKERTDAAMGLEGAETQLIVAANAERLKAGQGEAEQDVETAHGEASADRWLAPKQRPTLKKPMIIGKTHDSVNFLRAELERLAPLVEEAQAQHRSGEAKRINAVFVEFDSLSEAQAAYQSLTHHEIMQMSPRHTGMHPNEIIWENLRIKGPERMIRQAITISIVCATVIFWSIPVALVGSISNLYDLTEPAPKGKTPWLSWLRNMPPAIFGVVSGLLPVILLALLMALLPPFLRWMAKLGGAPTTSAVEYRTSNYFFAFQVVQVFLVTTLSSSASAAVTKIIENPGSAPGLLSEAIPKANTFYLSYIILQGLGVFAGVLAALAGLVVRPLLAKFLSKTPRKLFIQWNKLTEMSYGTLFPIYTNLLVIAIAYSIIAPLVTGFSAIGLFLFYFGYRYAIMYSMATGPDTKGLLYPRALQQLFVGIYIAQIVIIGLLALAIPKGKKGATGPFALMIILLILTALFHVSLNASISPLLQFLPKSLDAEERNLSKLASTEPVKAKNGVHEEDDKAELAEVSAVDAPKHAKPSLIQKFLNPNKYCDYATMRRLMPTEIIEEQEVDEALVKDAYLPPAVWDEVPRLIIPRDPAGISGTEVAESGKVVPITDAGSILDEKNAVILDDDKMAELYFKEKKQRLGYEI